MNSQNGAGATPAGDTTSGVPTYRRGFGIAVDWVDRIAVVAVSGDLDTVSAPEVAEGIQTACRKEPAALIVDLSGVEFLGSAGMNLLIQAHREMAPSGRFGVVADGPATSRPLKMIGIDTIVAVYRTLDDALDDFA